METVGRIDTNERSWEQVHVAVTKRDIALVLGAGVSCDSGLPNWEELVRELAKEAEISDKLITKARDNGWGWPTICSLIRQRHPASGKRMASDPTWWPNYVRKHLYAELRKRLEQQNIHAFPNDRHKHADPRFVQLINDHNPTLSSIFELCVIRAESEWRAHPRVAALLTYNVDSLIQCCDRARHGTPRMFRTIERASKDRRRSKIPIYHLHGYLLPDEETAQSEAKDMLVLCEDDYNRQTDEPFKFATTVSMWALREFVCIFVGCSITDELMRRALFRSRAELREALRAEKSREPESEELVRHFAVVKRGEPQWDKFVEDELALIGVRPLWVEDFKRDLPEKFKRLRGWLDARD